MEEALKRIIESSSSTPLPPTFTTTTNASEDDDYKDTATRDNHWITCVPIFARGKVSTTWITVDQCVALIKCAITNDYDHEYCVNPASLPYTRLYFDIDCLECKSKKRDAATASDGGPCAAGAAAVSSTFTVTATDYCLNVFTKLRAEVARCLSLDETTVASNMPMRVMVCEKRPLCGFHVIFDVLIDFVARDFLMSRLIGIKLSDRHTIDWPKNLLLPYGRHYKHTLCWNAADNRPRVLPIVADEAEMLCPVRTMRTSDEPHISVELAPIGYDLQLVMYDTVVTKAYVARDLLTYTNKPLLARLCAWTSRTAVATAGGASFDRIHYNPPHIATSKDRVVHRKVFEWFTSSHASPSSASGVMAVATTGDGVTGGGEQTTRYHIQEPLEPYEKLVKIVERGGHNDGGHGNDRSSKERRNTTTSIARYKAAPRPPSNTAPPRARTQQTQFFPFTRAQLEFYDEAVSEVRTNNTTNVVDHDVWMAKISKDTIKLIDLCLRSLPPSSSSSSPTSSNSRNSARRNNGTDNNTQPRAKKKRNSNATADGSVRKRGRNNSSPSLPQPPSPPLQPMSPPSSPPPADNSSSFSNNGDINAVRLREMALQLLDNAVACEAYTSTVSTLIRYGQSTRLVACKYLIRRYSENRAGAFVWTRLALTPELDTFLTKNFTGTDFVYLLLRSRMKEMSTQSMFRRLSANDILAKAVNLTAVFARDIFILKWAGSSMSYFTGHKITIDRDNKMREFYAKVDDVEIRTSHVEIDSCYSYRTNCGMFNPVTGVFEANGPSLNELVYRDVGCAPVDCMLTFRPELFHFSLDCFLKIPSYIRQVESTVPVLALVCPLWPLYESYPDFESYQQTPIRNFAVSDFQTLLVDLNRAMQYPWPKDLCARVARIARARQPLGMLIVTCVGTLYTLSRYVAIDPLDVVQVLISLLGHDAHSYIGIPAWDLDDEHNLTVSAPGSAKDPSGSGGDGGIRAVSEDDILADDDSLDVSFRRLLLDRLAAAENKQNIMKQLNEMLEDETGGNVPLARTLGFRSLNAQKSVDMISLFKKIDTRVTERSGNAGGNNNINKKYNGVSDCDGDSNDNRSDGSGCNSDDVIDNIGDGDDEGEKVDLNRHDYVRCAILMAAWFVRMGELHALNDCPLFEYINAERPRLYEQLVEFARAFAPIIEAKDLTEQTDHFLAFVERTEPYDPEAAIWYPTTYDIPQLRQLHAYDPTYARLIGESEALNDYNATVAMLTDSEKRSIASAIVHLLRSGGFSHDYFIEFCKMIANLEYLGNRLRLGYNFYGTSSSGKSFFTELLDRVFASGSNAILSSRMFHDGKPTDNDVNAIMLGTNFLVHLNEDDELQVEVFKKYVDFNYLSTRDMKKNLSTKFAIRGKVFFTSNHYVQVNKPFDSGFHNKYYPIFFNFDFVKIHDRLDRLMEHRSALKLFTTKYLGGQVLMQRYPAAGGIGSLDADVTVLSRQFLTRFFLFDVATPVSAKKTARVEQQYLRYFRITNPIQYFYHTVEVRPTNRGLEESRVRQVLLNWWEKHKCQFARIKSFATIADSLMNHFDNYRVGKKYNMEFVINK